MVAIFKNDRRNIHVLISQFLIHVHNFFCVLTYIFWAKDYKNDSNKYANLIFYHGGSHFFKNGRQNIRVLLSQFLIDLEKKILVSKYTFCGGHFLQWSPEYTCFNIPATNQHRKKSWCLNIHFQNQDRIRENNLKYVSKWSDKCWFYSFIDLFTNHCHVNMNADKIYMVMFFGW